MCMCFRWLSERLLRFCHGPRALFGDELDILAPVDDTIEKKRGMGCEFYNDECLLFTFLITRLAKDGNLQYLREFLSKIHRS
jgi:hypothetical protein